MRISTSKILIMLTFPGSRRILIVAANVLIFVAGCDSYVFDNKQFDQQVWLANPVTTGKDGNSLRLQMSQNILDQHLKLGMTRQETRKLLGQPSFVGKYCSSRNTCDNYDLGEYVLVLTFDSTDKLIYREVISI
jgi:hypothetical protein